MDRHTPPQNSCVEVPTPSTSEVTQLGENLLTEVIKLGCCGVALTQLDWSLPEKEGPPGVHTCAEGRSHDDRVQAAILKPIREASPETSSDGPLILDLSLQDCKTSLSVS